MAGFIFDYMLGGGVVYLTSFTVKAEESIEKGDMCKITSGEAEPADSGSDTMYGVAANDAGAGEIVKLYPPDSVYAVIDDSMRKCGDFLSLSITSNGITEGIVEDFIVTRNRSSSEDTLVTLCSHRRMLP